MKYLFIIFLALSANINATQSQEADVHEIVKSGFLPEPYNNFYVHIKVDESHSVSLFEVKVAGVQISLNNLKLNSLTQIDINRIYVAHEIFRNNKKPFDKINPQGYDYFEIRIGSKEGIEEDHTWYADFYIISVDLESGVSNIQKTSYKNP